MNWHSKNLGIPQNTQIMQVHVFTYLVYHLTSTATFRGIQPNLLWMLWIWERKNCSIAPRKDIWSHNIIMYFLCRYEYHYMHIPYLHATYIYVHVVYTVLLSRTIVIDIQADILQIITTWVGLSNWNLSNLYSNTIYFIPHDDVHF